MDDTGPKVGLRRLGQLARLGARVGFGKVASAFGSTSSEAAIAEAAKAALGQLKGLALKAGQVASYVEGIVPAEHQALYERALASLRDAAPPMSAGAARQVIEKEFGRSPEALFSEWEETPFAAASLGQVHRARVPSGEPVAVKVQYPGIDGVIESELGLGSFVASTLFGPVNEKLDLDAQVQELRARLLEELDYLHEGRAQEQFRALFAGDPRVHVPRTHPAFSARRVLTSELLVGRAFDDACRASEDERRAWAETLWRFVFTSLLNGMFNADPHPGNYVFLTDGGVGFLDFGCTKMLPAELTEGTRRVHRAAADRDEAAFLEAGRRIVGHPRSADHARRMDAYFRLCFAPLFAPGPFRITRPYARRLLAEMRDNLFVLVRGSRKDYAPLPPDLFFLNRLQLGFYSVLARLDVTVDYHAVERDVVDHLAPGSS